MKSTVEVRRIVHTTVHLVDTWRFPFLLPPFFVLKKACDLPQKLTWMNQMRDGNAVASKRRRATALLLPSMLLFFSRACGIVRALS
jgi:hypothetical protein